MRFRTAIRINVTATKTDKIVSSDLLTVDIDTSQQVSANPERYNHDTTLEATIHDFPLYRISEDMVTGCIMRNSGAFKDVDVAGVCFDDWMENDWVCQLGDADNAPLGWPLLILHVPAGQPLPCCVWPCWGEDSLWLFISIAKGDNALRRLPVLHRYVYHNDTYRDVDTLPLRVSVDPSGTILVEMRKYESDDVSLASVEKLASDLSAALQISKILAEASTEGKR